MELNLKTAYDCALLVLNWNGEDLLADCLASLVTAVSASRNHCRLLLVDNRSTDESVNFVKKSFPSVEIVVTAKNDYLFSLNQVIAECKEETVIVLNNDISVDQGFIDPLLSHFSHESVFAVTSKIFNCDDSQSGELTPTHICRLETKGSWYRDYYDESPDSPVYVQLASGAVSAYRRKMFLQLGGFDPLFRPGYAEDLDLSFRAWQRGWHVILEPSSIIFHKGSVSMDKELGEQRARIAMRNRLLFLVKNCGSGGFILKFLLLYPKRIVAHHLFGDKELARAMVTAIPRLPAALWKRIWIGIRGFRMREEASVLDQIGKAVIPMEAVAPDQLSRR